MKDVVFREYINTDNAFVSHGLCSIEALEKEPQTSLQLVDNFPETISNYLSKINLQPSTLIIIVEKWGKPCGFIMGIVESQHNPFSRYSLHGLIQAVWVEPESQRQAIGTALVDQLLSSFAEFEVPYCDLAYHPGNQQAQKFWHKLGFLDAQITARKFLT